MGVERGLVEANGVQYYVEPGTGRSMCQCLMDRRLGVVEELWESMSGVSLNWA